MDPPDNIAENPHSLPYASNVGAPVIKANNLSGWKHGSAHRANQHFKDKYEELKLQYEKLAEEIYWNDILFNAEMKFKPVIGKVYHLYKNDKKYFISLFSKNECSWGEELYQGSFRLNYDNRWEVVK